MLSKSQRVAQTPKTPGLWGKERSLWSRVVGKGVKSFRKVTL